MKKTSMIRRAAALCLLFLLAFSLMGVSAYADELSSTSTGKITVSGITDKEVANVTVTAYQLMTVSVDDTAHQPKEPGYQWVDGVANWVSAHYPGYIDADNGNAVTDKFSPDATPAVDAETFYDELAAAIGHGVTLAAAGSVTGNGDIEDLSLGNYLLITTGGVRVYKPSAVNLVPKWDNTGKAWNTTSPVTAEVQVKSSGPSVDKEIVDATGGNPRKADNAGIGDTVYFKVTVDVPKFPENAVSRNFVISDTLSDGLTFNASSLAVKGVSGTGDSATETPLSENTNYAKSGKNPKDNSAVTFALDFSTKSIYDTIKGYDKIVVTYSAVLNQDAVVGSSGNSNTAKLDYSNNPYDTISWKDDGSIVKVYTYGIDVTKVDAKDTSTTLPGAEFTAAPKSGGTTGSAIQFVKESDGVYHKASAGETGGDTKVVTNDNGKIVLKGLDAGSYTLTETKAPNGYNLPQSTTIDVEIKDDIIDGEFEEDGTTPKAGPDGKVELPGANNTVTHKADGLVPLTITNTKLFTLPTTGGAGTVLFSVIGILLMGGGVALITLIVRRKRT